MASKVKAATTVAPATNGSLPKGWRMIPFGEIAESVNDRVMPTLEDNERYIGLEHLDPGRLTISRWGSQTDLIGQKLRMRKGDIIFGRRNAYLRRVALAPFDGICSAHSLVLRPKGDLIEPAFLPFLMQSAQFMERAEAISVGSLSPTINWTTLRNQEFPLPPKDEQLRIAELLCAADESVESRFCVLGSIGSAWQSLIDSIVPDPCAVPGAQLGRLDDLCDMQNGRPFPSSNYSDTGFKLLRPGNLAPNGRLIWPQGATVFLDRKFANENEDWIIRPGDVVINLTAQSLEDGFMGRVCLAATGDESLLNQRLGRFIVKNGTEREYVFRILQTSRFRRVVESHCEGSKVRHTYFRHFANLPVALLSQDEQQRVINAGRDVDNARESAKQAVDKAQSLFAALREHLLRGDS